MSKTIMQKEPSGRKCRWPAPFHDALICVLDSEHQQECVPRRLSFFSLWNTWVGRDTIVPTGGGGRRHGVGRGPLAKARESVLRKLPKWVHHANSSPAILSILCPCPVDLWYCRPAAGASAENFGGARLDPRSDTDRASRARANPALRRHLYNGRQ